MTTSPSSEALRAGLFAEAKVRLAPLPLPKGALSPTPGQGGDVFVSTQGQYTPKVDSALRAVDPVTGQERWKVALPADLVAAPVASADGSTVWAPGEGVLRAFSAAKGELQGSWGPGTLECLRPVPLDGDAAVVANWKNTSVAALEPGRDQPLWETPVGVAIGSAVVGPGRVYASVYGEITSSAASGALQALDSATGEPLWRYESKTLICEKPATGPDGVVYVPASEGSVVALDPNTGEPLWKASTQGRPGSPAVCRDGKHLLVGDSEGFLQSLDAATGQPVWKIHTPGAVRLAPGLGTDGTLCVVSGDHHLSLVEEESGLLTAQADMDGIVGASPVSRDDGSYLVWNLAGEAARLEVERPESAPAPSEGPLAQAPEIRVGESEVSIGGIRLPRR